MTFRGHAKLLRARSATFLAAILLSGCSLFFGLDGSDGEASIAYSWLFGPITFATNDPAFTGLSFITNGDYRLTQPGTYSFEYIAWDDTYWVGNYTIYVNEGEPGSFLTDGDAGSDIYFELSCLSLGAYLYPWITPYALAGLGGKALPALQRIDQETVRAVGVKPVARFEPSEALSVLNMKQQSAKDHSYRQVVEAGSYTIVLEFSLIRESVAAETPKLQD